MRVSGQHLAIYDLTVDLSIQFQVVQSYDLLIISVKWHGQGTYARALYATFNPHLAVSNLRCAHRPHLKGMRDGLHAPHVVCVSTLSSLRGFAAMNRKKKRTFLFPALGKS